MVAGYSATSTQDQNLTVTYKDADTNSYTNGQNFTANLKVTLSKEVKRNKHHSTKQKQHMNMEKQ